MIPPNIGDNPQNTEMARVKFKVKERMPCLLLLEDILFVEGSVWRGFPMYLFVKSTHGPINKMIRRNTPGS